MSYTHYTQAIYLYFRVAKTKGKSWVGSSTRVSVWSHCGFIFETLGTFTKRFLHLSQGSSNPVLTLNFSMEARYAPLNSPPCDLKPGWVFIWVFNPPLCCPHSRDLKGKKGLYESLVLWGTSSRHIKDQINFWYHCREITLDLHTLWCSHIRLLSSLSPSQKLYIQFMVSQGHFSM